MKKIAAFLTEKRKILLCIFLALAAVSLPLAGMVNINYNLTKYLSADSRMKQGMELMEQEFGPASSSGLRVMFSGLEEAEKEEIRDWLSGLPQVSAVDWAPGRHITGTGIPSTSWQRNTTAIPRKLRTCTGRSMNSMTGGVLLPAGISMRRTCRSCRCTSSSCPWAWYC